MSVSSLTYETADNKDDAYHSEEGVVCHERVNQRRVSETVSATSQSWRGALSEQRFEHLYWYCTRTDRHEDDSHVFALC